MTSNPSRRLINDIEALLATSASLFASEGSVRQVAILANAEYSIDWCREEFGQDIYHLYLQVPDCLYSEISDEIEVYENRNRSGGAPVAHHPKRSLSINMLESR
ncbi:hypothetical protein, partial [Microcoleus sp. D3_18_C4]|uniref:hypothetical protein n=1 Tax=Microcoleus sp. D3_18_C4 TaxID=3055335 RepID=UPI002FD27F23